MRLIIGWWIMLAMGVSAGADEPAVLDPEFWRAEATEHLGPLWLQHAPDQEAGGYHLRLSRQWEADPGDKMPAMISRQIYGFSTAYLLSGDERYLEAADRGAEFLLRHGWDGKHGGWFDRISRDGQPLETTKTAPLQLYTNVGLTQYAFVTGDAEALERVRESVRIRQTHGRDPEGVGYGEQFDRELRVTDWEKSKHAHYGYVGSLLLNLFLVTRSPEVLDFSRELTDLSLEKMRDERGWFYGFQSRYDRDWQRQPKLREGEPVTSVGAQLTAALAVIRLAHQTGEERYRQAGLELGRQLTRYGFDAERGVWLDVIRTEPPHRPVGETKVEWWHQIYGAFLQLHLFHLTGEQEFLRNFERTERFFVKHFHDKEYGGVFPAVSVSGEPVGNPRKAGPWRTAYHEMEHALLNTLYLSLFVERQPVTLHFRFRRGGTFPVNPVDASGVRLQQVWVDGEPWEDFDAEAATVRLPDGDDHRVQVTLGMSPKS